MNRKIILIALLFLLTIGCSFKKEEENKQKTNKSSSNEVIDSVKAIINEKEYQIKVENNKTAQDFTKMLPKEFEMIELNGNEKYVYLEEKLKTNPATSNHIEAGDVMMYGNNCLVIFYKSFETSYSYTKIGHIENLPNLGSENIKVKIEK